ncbi:MAG: polysaccharide biosynthesis transport protein [Blastocatellia bacterium]
MAEDKFELEKRPAENDAALVHPGYPRPLEYPSAYAYGYGSSGEDSGINLRELWRIFRKRKWLIITIPIIVTFVVGVEAYRTRSIYKASAFIEIGKETPAVRMGNGAVIQTEDSDVFYPQLGINTYLFRLSSEPLLEEVVVNLDLDRDPRFTDTAKRSFIEGVQGLGSRLGVAKSVDSTPDADQNSMMSQAGKNLPRTPEETQRLAPYVGMIAGGLQGEQVKDTRTLKVTFTHTNPEIAAAVANGVARVFIEQTFENKTEQFTSASQWLETQTREFQARVEKAERALADYSREHNIFSLEGKENLTTEKLTRLHDQATRAETDRMVKQSVYEEVKAGRAAQLPAAFADLKIAALQSKLDELQANAEKLSLKYGPEHPQVIETQQQIRILKDHLNAARQAFEDKLKSEYATAVRDDQLMQAALQKAKNEAVQQNQDAIQYNILKQEVDTAKGLYIDFMQKTSQAKIQVAQQHNNLRLIQPARPSGVPAGPNRFRSITLGFFMSLLAGCGLAYFLEYLDNTIKTVDDVSRFVRLPALGVIPVIGTGASKRLNTKSIKHLAASQTSGQHISANSLSLERLPTLDNRSTAAEAYRVVRTSMLLSSAGKPPKTVLVTSGQPGEGKTTTVVNTAISLAQLGASVLIIDCDLRRPSTHKVFGIEHTRGLSTYLSRDIQIDGLIHKLPIANLSLLPCGPIPPNPAELISSERMQTLLKTLSEQYDHILIDSPPLINVTDPVILSSLVDGVILVIHGGKSTRGVAQRARQELVSVGAKIFGVVLNNIDLRHEGYADYYYYYRYYSGYYHSENEGDEKAL